MAGIFACPPTYRGEENADVLSVATLNLVRFPVQFIRWYYCDVTIRTLLLLRPLLLLRILVGWAWRPFTWFLSVFASVSPFLPLIRRSAALRSVRCPIATSLPPACADTQRCPGKAVVFNLACHAICFCRSTSLPLANRKLPGDAPLRPATSSIYCTSFSHQAKNLASLCKCTMTMKRAFWRKKDVI